MTVPRRPPTIWQRWLHRPHRIWLRRAIFQIHLWLAIAIGAYVVVISVSGSAVVFRRELNTWLVPRAVPSTVGTALMGDELRAAAQRAYPQHSITAIRDQRGPERPVLVMLERRGVESERLFDPYAGIDMGLSYPPTLRFVEWLVDLHDNLLAGEVGRNLNGLGAILVTVLLSTGAVIWWPGRSRWKQSLIVRRPTNARHFVWQLHSVMGFWSLALLFIWAFTAIYFAFPEPVEALIDRYDPNLDDFERPGEALLLWFIKLHFGRFGGLEVRFLYVVLGLLPAALFVSGFYMWWTRVVRPARNRALNNAQKREAA